MPQTPIQFFWFTVVVAVGAVVSHGIMRVVMHRLLEPGKVINDTLKRMNVPESEWEHRRRKIKNFGVGLQSWVGSIEIVLFAIAIVYRQPLLILLWVGAKYIASWGWWGQDQIGRTFYNRNLFGSGLNILLGIITGGFAQLAIRCAS